MIQRAAAMVAKEEMEAAATTAAIATAKVEAAIAEAAILAT